MREAWMDDAACTGRDPELFYPERKSDTEAKLCCYDCPVREKCLQIALERYEVGIWGGTNDEQRKLLRRKLNITVKPPPSISHGTASGARAHYRANEKPCKECRDAALVSRRKTTTGLQRDPHTGRWLSA
jgi:WhiB family redox-sensing transcriptional regulator